MIGEILTSWVVGAFISILILIGLIGVLLVGIKIYDWIKEDPVKNSIIAFIVPPLLVLVPYFLGKFVLGW